MLHRSAFTLVEMSIVLVIIGLLVGGVLSGQSLIRSAGLRATIEQITDIRTAKNIFRDKYMGLPGDITNAQSFWPTAANGNGDGRIESATPCGFADPDCDFYDGERPQFFSQLSLAGIVPGGYDNSTTLGKGYPTIKLYPNDGMFVVGAWNIALGSNMGIDQHATDNVYLYMGICNTAAFGSGNSSFNDCGIFMPEEAWNIDTKLDDGKPGSGIILGESYNTPCTVGNLDQAYNLTDSGQDCNLMISMSR